MYTSLEHYIDGNWVKPTGSKKQDVINPANSKPIGELGHVSKGDLDKALAAFTKLAGDNPKGFYHDRSLYHQARIAERKGNPAEAVKLYKEVLEKSPQTALRDEISNRLAVLETK